MHLRQTARKVLSGLLSRNRHHEWNIVIDRLVSPVDYDLITCCPKSKLDVSSDSLRAWLETAELSEFIKPDRCEKKGLEFFFSCLALSIQDQDTVLDAAGGRSAYLTALERNGNRGQRYLSDHIYSGTAERVDGVTVVGGDVGAIHLPDANVDKIACHHAFEHFQGSKDTEFVREAFRLLRPKGVLAITPLFLGDRYVECWNRAGGEAFDPAAATVVDQSASLPGGDEDGHFARIYDEVSLVRRVVGPAGDLGFEIEMVECQIDGFPIPDMEKCFGSILNRPLRVLVMRKP